MKKLLFGTCASPIAYAGIWDFAYDGDGVRTVQVYTPYSGGTPQTPVVTTYFMGGLYEETDGVARKYYAVAGMTVAMNDGDGLKFLLTDHLGSVAVITDADGDLLSQQRYKPFGGVRTDTGSITQTDFGKAGRLPGATASACDMSRRHYTGQRNLPVMGLMDYKARLYDPYLNRWTQPDTIVPDAFNPQALDRYAYTLNNPVRYTDPSGHAYCPYSECDIVVTAHDEKMHLRGNLHRAAEGLVRDLGGINDLEAMTSIIAAGASAYRTYDRLLPELSNIFLGTSNSGPGTLLSAALGDGCAGVGRDPSSCPSNQDYFTDQGFHPDFQDGANQLFHLWAYIAETSAPGNAGWGAFGNRTANIGNYVHEVVQSGLGFEGGQGTSWNDYVLSEAGMQIGALITDQSITPAQLAGTIVDMVGQQGAGSGGMLEALLLVNGPLGGQ